MPTTPSVFDCYAITLTITRIDRNLNALSSPRAIEMGVYVVRAFVKLRELLSSNRELARRFAQLETRLDKKLTEQDRATGAIFSAIRELMQPPVPKRRPIGFTADLEKKS